jgi:AraC-like DNA-binding protein
MPQGLDDEELTTGLRGTGDRRTAHPPTGVAKPECQRLRMSPGSREVSLMSDYAREIGCLRLAIDALPEETRQEAWREAFARAVLRVDIEPAADEPLRSRFAMHTIPGVVFGHVSTSACRVERTAELVKDNQDDIALLAVTHGAASVIKGESETHLGAGEAIFVHNGTPGAVVYSAHARHFIVSISARLLQPLGIDPDAAAMHKVSPDTDVLRVMLRYARVMLAENTIAPDMHAAIASHFRDLATILLRNLRDPTEPDRNDSIRAARLAAIKADIAENAGNDLSVIAVALRHGITPRYVAKLFEAEGTTFSQFVLWQRLERARRMLTDPICRHMTISAVAFEAGFGDLSYFNRVFRKHYNATPSEMRALAHVGAAENWSGEGR